LLFEHFVRLAAEIRPRYILFENVRGLVTARGHDGVHGGALATVLSAFSRIGYATSVSLMNSADFGSPQRRVRLFVIAARVWPLPVFPSPTHADLPAGAVLDERRPWVTLGEFLRTQPEPDGDDIVRPTPALAQQLKNVADGSGLRSAGARETTRPGGHWGYRQGTFIADQAAPARTVTAASTQDWIRTDRGLRRLTWRECAGLQGFPRDWVFWGPKAARFRQIGNAVPAVFGEVLGHALMTAMDQADDRRVPESRALPKELVAAIDYTKRDHSRNGASREFAKSALAHQPASVVKGLGSAEQGQRKRHRTQAQSPANPLFSDL
jgi:DNA (cytosine-5)-methyltransferase 1